MIICCYDRKALNQYGSGHISPIGAYDNNTDSVLIMDVARFKYPPHWISLSILFDAMNQIDPDTNKSRGYVILTKNTNFVCNKNNTCEWSDCCDSITNNDSSSNRNDKTDDNNDNHIK